MKTSHYPINFKTIFPFFLIATIFVYQSCTKDSLVNINAKPIEKTTPKTTLNVIGHWLGEGQREKFVRDIVREYEFMHQDVKVNLKFPEEVYYDNLDRKSNEKYTAKVVAEGITDWDILRLNGEYAEVLAILKDPDWAKKHLVDFSEISEFKDGTIPELLTQKAMAEWNGIIPGPWLEGQYWAMWCNNSVASKIGINVKQFGMTFDDFYSYLQAAYTYNQSHPNDYVDPIFESYVWETSMAIAINLYGSLLDNEDEFLSKKITPKRLEAWGKTLEAMELIAKFKPLKKNWRKTEWDNTKASLLNEECLFYVNGSWMYNIWMGIDEKKTYNCMPTEFPSFNPLKFYPAAYQITWGVLNNSPNREEAVKFLLALNTPEISEEWVRTTKCPTGIKGNLSNVAFGADQFENFASHIQQFYKSNTYRYFQSSSWFLDEKHADTPNYYLEVIEGQMTAKEAMQRIRKNIGA